MQQKIQNLPNLALGSSMRHLLAEVSTVLAKSRSPHQTLLAVVCQIDLYLSAYHNFYLLA